MDSARLIEQPISGAVRSSMGYVSIEQAAAGPIQKVSQLAMVAYVDFVHPSQSPCALPGALRWHRKKQLLRLSVSH